MITVVCYLPLSNLNQPLIPWYNPFGDTFQLQIVDVYPFLSLMGTLVPYGALLSFPKWVVQQLGDVADKQLSCYQTSELFSSGENKHFLIQTSLLIARCAVCCIQIVLSCLPRKPPQSSLHPLSVSHMIVSGIMMMECGLVTDSVSPHQYSDPDQRHSPPVSAMCTHVITGHWTLLYTATVSSPWISTLSTNVPGGDMTMQCQ